MASTQPAPRYVSTRGTGEAVSFQQALLTGLAPDGGLYIPYRIPALDPTDWREPDRFAALALRVLARWIEETPREALAALLDDALSFPVPLVPLEGGGWDGVFILELFFVLVIGFFTAVEVNAEVVQDFTLVTPRRLDLPSGPVVSCEFIKQILMDW